MRYTGKIIDQLGSLYKIIQVFNFCWGDNIYIVGVTRMNCLPCLLPVAQGNNNKHGFHEMGYSYPWDVDNSN